MNKTIYIFFTLLIIYHISCTNQQERNFSQQEINDFKIETMQYQAQVNREFADKDHTPLDSIDLIQFKGLNFFEPDIRYKVEARFKRTPGEKPFEMTTTTDRLPIYVKYGELHFNLNSKKLVLNAYQNLEYSQKEEFKHNLFVPFTDLTNGRLSYGGGRYLDIEYAGEKTIKLDFNRAYNPYCAYSHRWSCPIPPEENDLNIEILAGVKSFH